MAGRIGIVGRGHLGQYLAGALPGSRLLPYRMEEITARHLGDLDVVVCAAGKTDLAWCEASPMAAWFANVEAPLRLARLVLGAGNGHRYVHLSSGCVWDGPYRSDRAPFEPTDPVAPACFYAWTKASCDALLGQFGAGSRLAVLRPRQVFSPIRSPRNTLTKLIQYPDLLSTDNSMTSAATIADTIRALGSDMACPLWGRVSNVYDFGISSPFQVGMLLAAAGLRSEPRPLTKSDLDAWHKPKRVDTVLHDALFEATVRPGPVLAALRRDIDLYARTA